MTSRQRTTLFFTVFAGLAMLGAAYFFFFTQTSFVGLVGRGARLPFEVYGFAAALLIVLLCLFAAARALSRLRRVRRAFHEYREIFDIFTDGVQDHAITMLDAAGRIRNWNRGAERLQGFLAKEMLGRSFSRLFPDSDERTATSALALKRARDEGRFEDISWRVRKDGQPFLARTVVTALRDSADGLRGYSILTSDMTESIRSETMLRKLSTSVEQAADLVIITDHAGTVEFANKAVLDVTGYSRDEFLEHGLGLLRSDEPAVDLHRVMLEAARSGRIVEATLTTRRRDDQTIFLNAAVTPIKDTTGAVTHVVFTGSDITNIKHLKDRIEYLASYDVVTGLPNRTLFTDRLGRGCSPAGERPFAVLAIDIDRFNLINEIYGLDAGNSVLKQVAESLSVSVGKGDTVGRLGSDEFGVILHDIARPADAVIFVKMIMKNVPQIIMAGSEQIAATLAIGIAVFPADGQDALTLMKHADVALASAKSLGRNHYQFYSTEMNVGVADLITMERRLVDALKNKEYVLSYQPYCHLTTKCVAGMEALIKWKNEQFGVVSPAKFIPMLEESGMIIDVGTWVVRTACRQLQAWGNGRSWLPVSVNLSLSQFQHEHLVEMIEKAIHDYRIDPRRLVLEVTESIFMKDLDFAIAVLKRLKGLGVQISIDDFGTGYSSLSYLKKFPVDTVKIDQSFVKDVTTDPDTTGLVMAIINMAHSLNLKTVAEGIETEEQWKILRLLKCDMGQGYYFSPAMTPTDCEAFLARSSA